MGGKQTQKRLFLLTDGCVSNASEIIEFCRVKTDSHTKLFTCGIGEGAAKDLLLNMADVGGGECQIFSTDALDGMMYQCKEALVHSVFPNLINCSF